MKLDVRQIVSDYVSTLRGTSWSVSSIFDATILFTLPLLAAYLSYGFRGEIGKDLFLSLFTLFGVFIAVFVSIQGVLVPLHSSDRPKSKDTIVDDRLKSEDALKKTLIKELSFSLSYLNLFSLISMAVLLVPITFGSKLFLFQWLSVALATHLILNLFVILKRMHALFSHQFR